MLQRTYFIHPAGYIIAPLGTTNDGHPNLGQPRYPLNGDKAYQNLDCVKYAAGLQEDLFSITAELTAGAKISNDEDNNIGLTCKDGTTIKFDRRVKTKDGWVAGVDVEPATNETAMVAFTRTVDINRKVTRTVDINRKATI